MWCTEIVSEIKPCWDTVRSLALYFLSVHSSFCLRHWTVDTRLLFCFTTSRSVQTFTLHIGQELCRSVHWNTNELTQQAENDQHPVTNKTISQYPSAVGSWEIDTQSPTQTVCALMSYNRCFYSNNPTICVWCTLITVKVLGQAGHRPHPPDPDCVVISKLWYI